MNPRESQTLIKRNTTVEVKQLFMTAAAGFFEANPEIISFGWYQWHTDQLLRKKNELYTTVDKPDINGNVGEYLWDADSLEKQGKVHEFLKVFDPNLLRITFGDNAGIFIYNDLTIEVVKHDPYLVDSIEL